MRFCPDHDLTTIRRILEWTGEALSRWHSMTMVEECTSANHSIKDSVVSFLDFSAWNVLVSHDAQLIWLVDFPGMVKTASRHYDLASFLHSLIVTRHHPTMVSRIHKWWT